MPYPTGPAAPGGFFSPFQPLLNPWMIPPTMTGYQFPPHFPTYGFNSIVHPGGLPHLGLPATRFPAPSSGEAGHTEQAPSVKSEVLDPVGEDDSGDELPFETNLEEGPGILDIVGSHAYGEQMSLDDMLKEISGNSKETSFPEILDPELTDTVADISVEKGKEPVTPESADPADADTKIGTCDEREDTEEQSRKISLLRGIFNYLNTNQYPSADWTKNQKSNFRKQCRSYFVSDGKLYHRVHRGKKMAVGKNGREYFPPYVEVILSRKTQMELIKMAHEGSDASLEAKSLSAHRGIKTTIDILIRRCYFPGLTKDVGDYVRTCERCQKVNSASLKHKDVLHPIPPPKATLKQIGIDLIQLPEVDGLKYVVIAIDYLSKYSLAKALPDKTAKGVAEFLFEWISLFGCPKIQINDQGKEFCNQVAEELHRLTGVEQRVTNAYNPQGNGLIERQNKTIKNGLLKVLDQHITRWPTALQGVMFAHRTQRHASSGFSPFYLLFGQHPVLPLDLKIGDPFENDIFESLEEGDDLEYDVDGVNAFVQNYLNVKERVLDTARANIKEAQERQKKDFDKRHSANHVYKVGDKVLLKNLRRRDRKGGWQQEPYTGPYIVTQISKHSSCRIKSLKTGKELAKYHRLSNLKPFYERVEKEEDPDEKEKEQHEGQKREENIKKETELEEGNKGEDNGDFLGRIGLLKNGNLQKSIEVHGCTYALSNTCGVDSAAQLVALALSESPQYTDHTRKSKNKFLKLASVVASGDVSVDTYCLRAEALLPFVSSKRLRNIHHLNISGNVVTLLGNLLKGEPCVEEVSTCEHASCPTFQRHTERAVLSIDLHSGEDLRNLEALLDHATRDRQSTCKETVNKTRKLYCQGQRTRTSTFKGTHIFIEPVQIDDNPQKFLHCFLHLGNIPTQVTVRQKTYKLRGAVIYIGGNDTSGIGHYVAYGRHRDGSWVCYNDLQESIATIEDPSSLKMKCHLLCFTV